MSAWRLVEAVVEEVRQPDSGINGLGDRRGGRGGRGEFLASSKFGAVLIGALLNVLKC